MRRITPETMQAVAIDNFGDLETLMLRTLPVPEVGSDQVLVRVESAGIGKWDVFERQGMFAQMFGLEPRFPYVLGTEGAGTVAAVGRNVTRFREGEKVYGLILLRTPKEGFYAEYAAVDAGLAWAIPGQLTMEQAGAMPVDAGTSLRGLTTVLRLKAGETLMIFGASGGLGHMAVQLARRMEARVFAVASGEDGVRLARRLGADAVVDGHSEDVVAAARDFAPEGLDAALFTAGGETAERALAAVRIGGHVAYPNGVEPIKNPPKGVRVQSYNADYDTELMEHLNRLIAAGPFDVHIARTFSLNQAAEAHRALESHYIGRLALRPNRGTP